jgi:hypothetical protein
MTSTFCRGHMSSQLTSEMSHLLFSSQSTNRHDMGYYLTDGIYPEWSAFVKTISHPTDTKKQYFTKVQESARKDIEQAL